MLSPRASPCGNALDMVFRLSDILFGKAIPLPAWAEVLLLRPPGISRNCEFHHFRITFRGVLKVFFMQIIQKHWSRLTLSRKECQIRRKSNARLCFSGKTTYPGQSAGPARLIWPVVLFSRGDLAEGDVCEVFKKLLLNIQFPGVWAFFSWQVHA